MIKLENISKSYGEVQALNQVSLEIEQGELFGLIGPDGAGKTSLMRILMTLLLPDSGFASVCGLEVEKNYKQIRRKVGYMPGRFSLYQDLSVIENLEFFATVFGTTIEENYHLIKDIYQQIEPFKDRLAGKLSGGMKQKLALSCALIHKPEVLILDEPTTGVDAVSRKEFWEMLKKLQKFDITILVSTPYMDEADLCDRVALMQNGHILQVDTPSAITEKFERKLLAVRSKNMSQLMRDVRTFEKTNNAFAFGQFVHFTSKEDDVEPAELEEFLKSKNHQELQVKLIKPSIEDVFMDLMTQKIKAMEKVIEVRNMLKKFGSFVANDHLNFDVYKGEIFGFLGANGAGKTTAIRILCGLSSPTSGDLKVAGFDVYTQTEKIKQNIGYMSQKFSLYEDMTIAENIRFFSGIYKISPSVRKQKEKELLERLDMIDAGDKLIADLPLGWKQKLAFSIAIFHDPKIVFLDEPTGGVDPVTRRKFWDLIYEAADHGITVFVTTHYMDEAEYCDRVSIMNEGKIEALDTPEKLKEKYQAEDMDGVFLRIAR